MAKNVILHDLEINGTTKFLDLQNIDLDTTIAILSALVQKSKTVGFFVKSWPT